MQHRCTWALLALAACTPPERRLDTREPGMLVGTEVVEVWKYSSGPQHGVSNGLAAPPPKMALRGVLPTGLMGFWSTETAMSGSTLELEANGRFQWSEHGCTGTTYWLGEARRDGSTLLLVPDKPDWMFGGGHLLDIVAGDEGTQLVPHPRSKDDLSGQYPLRRQR
jgi:hypothetical protein